ncbi:unnamed protein product [Thlaspi arvense]|uniref:Uncharacterized protein n=1 Tax=Thlaspi arvense TaxID=13288 RepID=A0AAU9RN87_THLAR|nr:unnamed protein product [Thlaspi arvense]
MSSIDEERSLLEVEESILQEEVKLYAEDGSVDINGNPPLKQNTGNWKACPFIFVPSLKPTDCKGSICPPATMAQQAVLFSGLYLIALGTGGIKPCVSSFGADQFDQTDPKERVRKSSFFNWFYFSINVGAFVSSTLLVWIQENCGWELGFLIPTVFMGLATASFFFGTPLYRFQKPGGSPITRSFQVLVASYRKWNLNVHEEEDHTPLFEITDVKRKIEHTDGYKKIFCPLVSLFDNLIIILFLDKAAIISEGDTKSDPWKLCTVTQVEEVKILLRLFPIWASGIVFSVLHSQIYTLFVQQGRSMRRTIGSFEIPPATLGMFDTASVLISVPVYDRLIVPFVRRFTGLAKGFTDLQRMGIGLFVSVLSLAVAAIVETVRLRLARDIELVESGDTVPLSIFWQIPQYFLMGTAGVFFFVGRIQFFYEQSPDSMRSMCSAWALLTTTLGNYLSSMIVTLVACLSGKDDGWIPSDNLNIGHLDYFFWLLVCLGCVNIPVFVFFSVRYTQKKVS